MSDEIRRPVAGVTERWEETHSLTLTIVSILSASTLVLITIALFSLANVITKPIVTMSKVIPPIGAEALSRRPPAGCCRLFLGPGFRLAAR